MILLVELINRKSFSANFFKLRGSGKNSSFINLDIKARVKADRVFTVLEMGKLQLNITIYYKKIPHFWMLKSVSPSASGNTLRGLIVRGRWNKKSFQGTGRGVKWLKVFLSSRAFQKHQTY